MPETIRIQGARANNLKNIDIELPRNKMIVFTIRDQQFLCRI